MRIIINKLLILLIISSCSNLENKNLYQSRVLASGATAKPCTEHLTSLIKETYYEEVAAESLKEGFEKLTNLDLELVAGAKVPGWQEVENLKEILAIFEDVEKKYKFPSEQDRVDFFERVFAETENVDKFFVDIKPFLKKDIQLEKMDTSQIETIVYYRKTLERVNSFLPISFRFKFSQIDSDILMMNLVKDGQEVVGQQTKLLADLFKTSGYKNIEKFRKAIKNNKSDLGDVVDAIVKEENIEIAIQRPINARWWIPKTGIHNQHVTGSSRGYLGSEGRNAAEASMIGSKYDNYAARDNDVKPKYGLLRPKTDGEIKPIHAHYGADVYIVDLEKVRDRLTWTPGDSLNRHANTNKTWSTGNVIKPKNWDDIFLPWSSRDLMIPILSNSYKNGQLSLTRSQSVAAGFDKLKFGFKEARSEYLEIQIWGPVRITDLKEFIFKGNEPEGDFLNELIANKIKIFDGRQNPPVEWVPPKTQEEIEQIIVSNKKSVIHKATPDIDIEKEVFDLGSNSPPKGQLKPIDRSFSEGELAGSTKPKWHVDEEGVEWLLKEDVKHKELQTSAEVISSNIYRKLGFNAPSTHIVTVDGKRYAAVRSLGKGLRASSLELNQSKQWKLTYFIGALLKDNDRIYSAKNNFDFGDGKFALFDFGGTLGSKARGDHKKVWPGWSIHSDAVGSFENTKDIEVVFGWFKDRFKPEGHAWNNVTREEAQEAIELLKSLTDNDIESIVKSAQYSNSSDENYMIDALKNRRDGLIEGVLSYFP